MDGLICKIKGYNSWPDNITREKRVELMRKFGSEKYPGFHPTDLGHDETGPYSDRKLSKSSWIEFSNTDTAKKFLKKVEHEAFDVEGTSIKMKPARTQFQKKRNYAMRKAEELLKASPKSGSSEVSIEWKAMDSKSRRISVNRSVAFTQTEYDVIGTFSTLFLDFSID